MHMLAESTNRILNSFDDAGSFVINAFTCLKKKFNDGSPVLAALGARLKPLYCTQYDVHLMCI